MQKQFFNQRFSEKVNGLRDVVSGSEVRVFQAMPNGKVVKIGNEPATYYENMVSYNHAQAINRRYNTPYVPYSPAMRGGKKG